jgi:hypothetical protein
MNLLFHSRLTTSAGRLFSVTCRYSTDFTGYIVSQPISFTPKHSGEDRVLYTLLDKSFYFLSKAVTFFLQPSAFFNDFSFICR